MRVSAEFTDTFGGEANYSWCRRVSLDLPDGLSDRAVVRRIKAALDLSGARAARRDDYGDSIVLWGLGHTLTVLFINWEA